MLIAAWILLIVVVSLVVWDHAVNNGYRPLLIGAVFLLTLFILTSCSPRVTDPCVTARPPVIGGSLEDSILVRDSTNGGCQ